MNYTEDCYVLKLDISGYFMSIDRTVLYKKIEEILSVHQDTTQFDFDLIMELVHQVVFNNPVKNCCIK